MTELELIESLKKQDNSAYIYLLEKFDRKVYNLCLSFIPNKEDAEDVAQEVFIQVFNSIQSFKSNAKLSTWIYSIAKNKSLDFIRKQKAKKRDFFKIGLFEDNQEKFDNYFIEFNHPGIELSQKENAQAFYKAINLLPDNQKTAYTLHKLDHLSYEEVAEIMNTSISSVESLMFRAKKNLQKILDKYYKENL